MPLPPELVERLNVVTRILCARGYIEAGSLAPFSTPGVGPLAYRLYDATGAMRSGPMSGTTFKALWRAFPMVDAPAGFGPPVPLGVPVRRRFVAEIFG